MFTKRVLEESLNLTIDADNNGKPSFSLHSEGPGYLDFHRLLLENKEDAWQSINSQQAKQVKPKIIFSLKFELIDRVEHLILVKLIDFFEVYLWQGSHEKFNQARPIADVSELLDKMHSMKAERADHVRKSLAEQGLEINQFRILDYISYNSFLQTCQKSLEINKSSLIQFPKLVATEGELDICGLTLPSSLEELSKLFSYVNPSLVTSIKLNSYGMKQFTLLKSYFPNVNKVIYSCSSLSQVRVPDIDIDQLVIEGLHSTKHVYTQNCKAKINTLELIGDELVNIELSKISLRALKIKSNNRNEITIVPPQSQLEMFEFRGYQFPTVPFDCFSSLTEFNLYLTTNSLLDLERVLFSNKLKLLRLHGDFIFSKEFFTKFSNLEHLELILPIKSTTVFPILDDLLNLTNLVVLSARMPEELDLSRFTQLKKLCIQNKSDTHYLKIIFPESPLFEAFMLEKCESKTAEFNLVSYKNLNKVAFYSCEMERVILPNKVLSYLLLTNCPSLVETRNSEMGIIDYLELASCNKVEFTYPVSPRQLKSNMAIELISNGKISCEQLTKLSLHFQGDFKQLREGIFTKAKKLQSLLVTSENPIQFDLEGMPPYLTDLEIIGSIEFFNKNNVSNNSIRSLTMIGSTQGKEVKFNLTNENLPELKILQLLNVVILNPLMLKSFKLAHCSIVGCASQYPLPMNPTISYLFLKGETHVSFESENNLHTLEVSKYSQIDFNKSKKIVSLSYHSNETIVGQSVNFDDLKKLEFLSFANLGNSSSFIFCFSGCKLLKKININVNGQSVFLLKDCQNLTYLEAGGESVKFSHLDNCQRLQELIVFSKDYQQPELRDIHLPNCTSLFFYVNNDFASSLDSFNEASSVSRFKCLSFCCDADTGSTNASSRDADDFSITFKTHPTQVVNKSHYRIAAWDSLVEKNNVLSFAVTINQNDLIECDVITLPEKSKDQLIVNKIKEVNQKTGFAFAQLKGKYESGAFHPLPILAAENDMVEFYSVGNHKIKRYWHMKKRHYYFFIPGNNKTNVEFYYFIKRNLTLQNDNKIELPLAKNISSLSIPEKLRTSLLYKIPTQLNLHFLLDPSLKEEVKLQKLIHYCKQFKEKTLNTSNKSAVAQLLQVISEQAGHCRHRSIAFFALAHVFLKIPILLWINEDHCYVEVPYQDKNNIPILKMIDLGGTNYLDLTPVNLRQNDFDFYASSDPNAKQAFEQYDAYFKDAATSKPITSFEALLSEAALKPVLVKLAKEQTAFALNESLHTYINGLPQPTKPLYLFINDPSELTFLVKIPSLENGKRNFHEGPLGKLIHQGGILCINWSNFNDNEIAIYKSLLDPVPTLNGVEVDKLTIVGCTQSARQYALPFLTRVKQVTLENHLIVNKMDIAYDSVNDKETISINLFYGMDWREKLLGVIKWQDKTIHLHEGALIQAAKERKHVVIYNPPANDKIFDLFMHRLQVERHILFNGKLLSVHPDFTISMKEEPLRAEMIASINLIPFSPTQNKKKCRSIYIGTQNWHELFRITKIDPITHEAQTQSGWLHTDESITIYLQGLIPAALWMCLADHIEKNPLIKPMDMILLPGAAIEGMKLDEVSHSFEDSTVFCSNDPDALSLMLSQKYNNATIVDAESAASFAQLILRLATEINPVDETIQFILEEQYILKRLTQGHVIILNGNLSATLYSQLLPFILGEKEIFLNGEWHSIAGKLICVLPKEMNDIFPKAQVVNFNFAMYQQLFNHCREILQIKQFYSFAAKLPHSGLGRPNAPTLSADRLKKMIASIAGNNLHPHNPIKGFFHFDYPKSSEDYAYLSVIAKILFCPEDTAGVNHKKLNSLCIKYQHDIPTLAQFDAWRVLNCFHGSELISILGNPPEAAIDFSSGFPKLNQPIFSRIEKLIQANVSQVSPVIPPRNPEKRKQKLWQALQGQTSVLFLKGPPGVGKSHTLKMLKEEATEKGMNMAIFPGKSNIGAWLATIAESDAKTTYVLFLDEANMATPSTWDFLKGLSRHPKRVIFHNQEYSVPDNYKIIATGNDESFPNRKYHAFFQNHAETIYFKDVSDDIIAEQIFKPILVSLHLYNEKIVGGLLSACHVIREVNPLCSLSFRDMQSLVLRFMDEVQQSKSGDLTYSLWKCALNEFACALSLEQRQEFTEKLRSTFTLQFNLPLDHFSSTDVSEPFIKIGDLFEPIELKEVIETIEQDLRLRQHHIHNPEFIYKMGILLEGDSGVGKSTLLKAILHKHGFSKSDPNPCKRYYEITAGTKDVYDLLDNAFNEGSIVLLDELNLDDQLENKLNNYMENKSDVSSGAANRGFMVFASQNPADGNFAGCKALSPALLNRFHYLRVDSVSKKGLQAIAATFLSKDDYPDGYVDAYLANRKNNRINTRTFYLGLNYFQSGDKRQAKRKPDQSVLSSSSFKLSKQSE